MPLRHLRKDLDHFGAAQLVRFADRKCGQILCGEHLDLDAFATYLAFQDLISNADDINGRGNNSYLHYDVETDMFTVVNWDLNLAFGQANVGTTGGATGTAGAGNAAGQRPARPEAAIGGAGVGGAGVGGAGGPGDQPNVLVDRFLDSVRAEDPLVTMQNLLAKLNSSASTAELLSKL